MIVFFGVLIGFIFVFFIVLYILNKRKQKLIKSIKIIDSKYENNYIKFNLINNTEIDFLFIWIEIDLIDSNSCVLKRIDKHVYDLIPESKTDVKVAVDSNLELYNYEIYISDIVY